MQTVEMDFVAVVGAAVKGIDVSVAMNRSEEFEPVRCWYKFDLHW